MYIKKLSKLLFLILDILNATEFGASCPQALESSLPSALLPEWRWSNGQNISKLMNEDCLYLNIYVPAKYYTNGNCTSVWFALQFYKL